MNFYLNYIMIKKDLIIKNLEEKIRKLEEELNICKEGLSTYKSFKCEDEKTFAYLINNFLIYKNLEKIDKLQIDDEKVFETFQYKQLLKEKDELEKKHNNWETTLDSLGFNDFNELNTFIQNNKEYISLNDKYENTNLELDSLKKEFNNKIKEEKDIIKKIHDEEILNINNKYNDDVTTIEISYEKKIDKIKLEYEDKLKKNKKNNKVEKKTDLNEIEINYGCPVYLFENKFNSTRIKCSEKTEYDFKYYFDLYEKCLLDTSNKYNALNDAAEYMINARNIPNDKSNRYIYRNKIIKSHEIYKKFGKKLNTVYININNMCKIKNIYKWKEWILYLEKQIEKAQYIEKSIDIKDDIENIVNKHLHENYIYNIVNNIKLNNNLNNIKYNTKIYREYIDNRKVLVFDKETKLLTYPNCKLFVNKKILTPEEKKNKKVLQNFNKKYNKLLNLNNNTIEWSNTKLKTKYYKNRIENILSKYMYYLDTDINKNGKNIRYIRNTYIGIYSEMLNSWEFDNTDDEDEIYDFKLIYNNEWKEYGVYESDEYKKVMKI